MGRWGGAKCLISLDKLRGLVAGGSGVGGFLGVWVGGIIEGQDMAILGDIRCHLQPFTC